MLALENVWNSCFLSANPQTSPETIVSKSLSLKTSKDGVKIDSVTLHQYECMFLINISLFLLEGHQGYKRSSPGCSAGRGRKGATTARDTWCLLYKTPQPGGAVCTTRYYYYLTTYLTKNVVYHRQISNK